MPFWNMALLDMSVIGIFFTLQLTTFSNFWVLSYFDSLDYLPYFSNFIIENCTWVFLGIWGMVYFFTMSEKITLIFINFHALKIKYIGKAISWLDMYLWKKTGKDSPASSLLLKINSKIMKLPKPVRFMLPMVWVIVWLSYNLLS